MDEATELLEYQKAMSVSNNFFPHQCGLFDKWTSKAICENLTPDTLSGELEFTDIFR